MAIAQLAPAVVLDPPGKRSHADVLELGCVLVALGWWATGLTFGTGGRQPHRLSVGLVLLVPALLMTRPWARLRPLAYVGTCTIGIAAALVSFVAPTGSSGVASSASWVYAAQLGAVVAAFCRKRDRTATVVLLVALAALLSFTRGWLAWWGGADPSHPFIGTFYWHNQQGVLLAAGALASLTLVLSARRLVMVLGWLGVAICGAGTVVSTSRASMMALALGVVLLLVLAVLHRDARAVAKVVAAIPLAAASAWFITGPPFFSTPESSPLSGTSARAAAGETLTMNSGYRLDDWGHAWAVFRHWPLTGSGFHGFASASAAIDPARRGSRTPFAHNGFLQLLVDGGLLLAVPVLVVLVAAAWLLLRGLRSDVQQRDWARHGLLAVCLVLALHSGVDFDWSYPTLLAGFAVVVGALVAPAAHGSERPTVWYAAVPALALTVAAVAMAWSGDLVLSVPLGGRS